MRTARILSIALCCAIAGNALAYAAARSLEAVAHDPDSWILVQLRRQLTPLAGGRYSTATGERQLDLAIAAWNVQKIDSAIPVAMSVRSDPNRLRLHGLDRIYRFHVPEGSDLQAMVDRFSRIGAVTFAEADRVLVRAAVVPDDPLFGQQWGLHQAFDADVDAPEAWEISKGDGTIIAFIDSGIDLDHEDFVGKIVPGWNFDQNSPFVQDTHGHGSGVASIAAANTDNGVGMAGVCWNCRIMPLVAGIWSAAADALIFAADNGARVVNISQGLATPSLTFAIALAYAHDAGLILVASAGNDNTTPIHYPARHPEFIAVGATDSSDRRALPFCFNSNPGSSYGPALDVVAPGDLIVGAIETGGYITTWCGTSQASPLVAGVAAVMQSISPSLGQHGVRQLIRAGAEDQVGDAAEDTPGFDLYHGWGRVNMDRTLRATKSEVTLRVENPQSTRVYFDQANPFASSYDFIRGDLGALTQGRQGVDLGEVVCLENDSADLDNAGHEDDQTPSLGEAFFYVARSGGAPGPGSYGGSSRNRDRAVIAESGARWIRDGEQLGAEYGVSVASAGDTNNDGFADVIVGARSYSNDQSEEGVAFVYLGSAEGLQSAPAWIGEGNQTDSWFGNSVRGAGDVNGDGYDDVIVGAPYHTNGQSNEGRAYLFLGSAVGPSPSANWTAEIDQASARFGQVVGAAGDVNGDGYDDVIVTAPEFDGGQADEGKAYLYLGSPLGLGGHTWTFESNQSGARLGFGGGSAGDVNGDGYDDVVLGAHRFDGAEIDQGRLYVFRGSGLGLTGLPTTIDVAVREARLGRSASTAGDVNGDGYADIVAGASMYDGSQDQEGAVFVFHGSATGIATTPAWSSLGGQTYARLGLASGTAGDVNGDGFSDVIAGAYAYDAEHTDEGRVWVYFGSTDGLSASPDWVDTGGRTSAWFGFGVAGAGNVNGDESTAGYPLDDIVVGGYGFGESAIGEGRAWLYHGSTTGPELPEATSDCEE